MRYFATYFDSGYLVPGDTLFRSLKKNGGEFRLFVVCLDDELFELLCRHGEPELVPLRLADIEAFDPEFAATRATRSRVEYYFTLSPVLPLYLLHRFPELDSITYLDADLYFYSRPEPLFAELDDGAVLIIPHRFPAEIRWREQFGIYNVQFQIYRRDPRTFAILHWWRDRCLEWCFARVEPARFADQKYLDEWPERFAGVVVSRLSGAGLAPWNWSNYRLKVGNDGILTVDDERLIFYHFQGFKLLSNHLLYHNLGSYGKVMNASLLTFFYGNYLAELRSTIARWRQLEPEREFSLIRKSSRDKKTSIRNLLSAVVHRNLMWVK